jgi:shikimate dehydrogenase
MTDTVPRLCGSVSGKASTLGVKMHDAGYSALGLNFKYIAVGTDDLDAAIRAFKALDFCGFGVSMPFKQRIISYLDKFTSDVAAIGACNTVVLNDGRLTGHNTDWQGAVSALDECSAALGGSATIVGTGGAARAIAYGLKKRGLDVYIAGRSLAARLLLVEELQLNGHCDLEEQGRFGSAVVVNATPSAKCPGGPVELALHSHGAILLDVVFSAKYTPLSLEAERRGWAVAKGWRMLFHQALHQFKLYTGCAPPVEAMAEALGHAL